MTFRPVFLLPMLILLAAPAAAQSDRSGNPATKAKENSAFGAPMVFYLAKGEADACGPGCAEWIAAEGLCRAGASQRLRTLLGRLGKRKLPIFFHSPGGLGNVAMAMGRLLREREMTAGVSETIPEGCVGVSEQACQALKRSGQTLAAELRSRGGFCASACVYALIGAKVRDVSPGARLASIPADCADPPDGRTRSPPDGKFPPKGSIQRVRRTTSAIRSEMKSMAACSTSRRDPAREGAFSEPRRNRRVRIDTRAFS